MDVIDRLIKKCPKCDVAHLHLQTDKVTNICRIYILLNEFKKEFLLSRIKETLEQFTQIISSMWKNKSSLFGNSKKICQFRTHGLSGQFQKMC